MASLSLPRVLHPRKTSLEIEREIFEKSQVCILIYKMFLKFHPSDTFSNFI